MPVTSITERIEKINMDWFLLEPALFKVLCSHQVVANGEMKCTMRSGARRIEYNPTLCDALNDDQLQEHFKAECIRILLKHPYTRQPQGCSAPAITMGSNCVLSDNCPMQHILLDKPQDFDLQQGMHFEYYARAIQEMMIELPSSGDDDGDGNTSQGDEQQQQGGNSNGQGQDSNDNGQGGNSQQQPVNGQGGASGQGNSQAQAQSNSQAHAQSDASALWKEDPMASAEVNEMIKVLEASNTWGSITGNLAGKIIASTRVKIDYRKVMQSFRADMLSSQRRLTRMRPNRRSGFENFGSVYRLTSRLLVAIDVSGSTTDKMVSDFFGIVNKFFKYGIEEVDVIQFDTEIKGEPEKIKKAKKKEITIVGRGGTSFQPVIDFTRQKKGYYHGVIILTDGYANQPKLPDYFNTPILWVLPEESLYEQHKSWMLKLGKSKACFIKENP